MRDFTLNVFCDENVTAMKTHRLLQDAKRRITVTFIEEILKVWEIVSVKYIYASAKTNDPLKRAISEGNDGSLTFIVNFGIMVKNEGEARKDTTFFTRDIRMTIEHTCIGLIDIYRHLLCSGFNFVFLGEFTTDYIETEFSKLRQVSCGTYFTEEDIFHHTAFYYHEYESF